MKDLRIRFRIEGLLNCEDESRSYLIIRDETSLDDVSVFKGQVCFEVIEEIMKVVEKYDK